jgi:hypothetical protein
MYLMREKKFVKQSSTLFLKTVVLCLGLAVLGLCIFALPSGITSDTTGLYRPILMAMYLPAIPFFIGLFQAWKLLTYIDKNIAFSELSVKALKYIKYCAVAIGLLYGIALPYIYYVAQLDDAPGVILIGLTFTFAPIVVAVFAAVLQKLLQNAIDIKSENDLTV